MNYKTVRLRDRKRAIVIRRSITSKDKYSPPKLPDKPKVTIGPKSYGKSKTGKEIVIRFYVSEFSIYPPRLHTSIWKVIDMDSGTVAEGTDQKGYKHQREAVEIAREYRDEFGAWTTMEF